MGRAWVLFIGVGLLACGEAIAPADARDSGVLGAEDATLAADAHEQQDAAPILDADGPMDAGWPDAAVAEDAAPVDAAVADAGTSFEPVVFVHGIGGSSAEFEVMKARLIADGWPADRLYAIDYPSPRWGCNIDNAEILRATIAQIRADTGAAKVDLVAHSMGTLSSRYYLERLGGLAEVDTYVTLGGLHHGNQSACLNPLPVCVWQELCPTKPYLMDLNAEPIDLGTVHWVSICSLTDDTADLETCHFDPAENIEVDGVDHAGPNGMLEHPVVYPHLLRVLQY